MTTIELPQSVLTKSQKRVYSKVITYYGKPATIKATVRYDDECGNGHNSFSITGEIWLKGKTSDCETCGCIHEDIAKHFQELAPLIKWHGVSADEPMHYVANTCYHASDRDHRGLLKGEKKQLRNGRTDIPVWERQVRNGAGEPVSIGSNSWRDSAECPVEKLIATWEPVWITGEGKARELDHARSSAVWPEATDEDLTAPGLKERLEARLPALLAEFKTAIESLGFTY